MQSRDDSLSISYITEVGEDQGEATIESQPAEATIEVDELSSPPPLPQQDNVPASSSAGEAGTNDGNIDLERALITCLGAVTRIAN